jgi:hypothetical protein
MRDLPAGLELLRRVLSLGMPALAFRHDPRTNPCQFSHPHDLSAARRGSRAGYPADIGAGSVQHRTDLGIYR